MTCGDADDRDCRQVLEQMYHFIDNELADADHEQIQHHLDECGPCLREVGLERVVKQVIARSCAERAPVELRQRVLFAIRETQLTIELE